VPKQIEELTDKGLRKQKSEVLLIIGGIFLIIVAAVLLIRFEKQMTNNLNEISDLSNQYYFDQSASNPGSTDEKPDPVKKPNKSSPSSFSSQNPAPQARPISNPPSPSASRSPASNLDKIVRSKA
jgi:hypothetical protein